MMTFSQWLAANKYDEAALTPENRKHLEAAWKAEIAAANPPPTPPTPKPPETVNDKLSAFEVEATRKEFITQTCEQWCKDNPYASTEKLRQLRELQQLALDDQKMTASDFRYQMLRFDRTVGMMVTTPREEQLSSEVVEAALCQTHGLKNAEQRFSVPTLEAARRRFRGGLTLVGMVALAARQNGYRGDIAGAGNLLPMWQAAIGHRYGGHGPMAAGEHGGGGGLSTITVPGILSNSANKFLMEQFLGGEQSWRRIAKIRTANDFKAMTFYRMTGANKFIKIPPGGEIQHGTLTELSHTLQVDTYGLQLGIGRTDFINDDLGAFTGRAGELGRGGIDSLNEVFYTEMLDDASFFTTGNLNYDDGAVDSVLSLAGLENADSIFASQTKPDGTPFGKTPKVLIVPRGLRARASTLVKATGLVGQGADAAVVPDDNPWSGMFEVVDSVYLQSTAMTGYSTTAWYLACDPNDVSFIEIAFLFGRDTPIIEESELEWNRLGMSMRAYWDWGCNKSEYRAAIKLKGAA